MSSKRTERTEQLVDGYLVVTDEKGQVVSRTACHEAPTVKNPDVTALEGLCVKGISHEDVPQALQLIAKLLLRVGRFQ